MKNKLFFFTSYEYQRINTPQFRDYVNTPEAQGLSANPAQSSYLNGLLTSGNPYLAGFAAQITPLLSPMNVPFVSALLNQNTGVFDDFQSSHDFITRVDYQPEERCDCSPFRYRAFPLHQHWRFQRSGAQRCGQTQRNDVGLLATWNHIFSPAVVNTARVQVVPDNTSSLSGF